MGYYITNTGKIKKEGSKDAPFNTEQYGFVNWFYTKLRAYELRDIIEERHPRAFLNL
jgi:hypothetical protein